MGETAKLLLIERLVAPPNEMPAAKFGDLNMLVSPGGESERARNFQTSWPGRLRVDAGFFGGTHNVIEGSTALSLADDRYPRRAPYSPFRSDGIGSGSRFLI